MKWEYFREEEFEGAIARSGGLCVLPMGCLEKHGQHLPVGTDSFNSVGLVEQAAEIEDVMIFPVGMWLGDVTGFHGEEDPTAYRNRGGIALSTPTMLTVLGELCDEIARNGFRKILFVNSHGGNGSLLGQFIRSQGYKPRNYSTMQVAAYNRSSIHPTEVYPQLLRRRSEFPYLTDTDMETLRRFAELGAGGHADVRETQLVYAYHPELVAPDRFDAESGFSTHRSDHLAAAGVSGARFWASDYPNMYEGYPPTGCTEAIGKAVATLSAERLARIFKLVKEDEECVRMAQHPPRF